MSPNTEELYKYSRIITFCVPKRDVYITTAIVTVIALLNEVENLAETLAHLGGTLSINDLLKTSLHVDLGGVPSPLVLPVEDAVAKVHDKEDGDADVIGEEGADGPLAGEEDGETVDQAQQGEHDHGDPRTVRLDP